MPSGLLVGEECGWSATWQAPGQGQDGNQRQSWVVAETQAQVDNPVVSFSLSVSGSSAVRWDAVTYFHLGCHRTT